MCAICVDGQKCLKKLKIEKNQEKIDILNQKINLYKRHKNDKNHQRFEFNNQIENIKKHSALINLDFKQNVKINEQSDVQINNEFYAPPQRFVFERFIFCNKMFINIF